MVILKGGVNVQEAKKKLQTSLNNKARAVQPLYDGQATSHFDSFLKNNSDFRLM